MHSPQVSRPGLKVDQRPHRGGEPGLSKDVCGGPRANGHTSSSLSSGEGPRAHIRKLAECIRWSYGAGIVLRLGNIARLELNYCVPMGVQGGDRYVLGGSLHRYMALSCHFVLDIVNHFTSGL